MTHPGNGCHVARWSENDRDVLVITGPAGEPGGIAPTLNRRATFPYPQMLWQTGWVPYPGSEWQEEPPGHWSRAVFPDTEMGGKR